MRFVLPGVMKMQELLDQLAAALRYADENISDGDRCDETIRCGYAALELLREEVERLQSKVARLEVDVPLMERRIKAYDSLLDEICEALGCRGDDPIEAAKALMVELQEAEAELHRLGR